MAKKEAGMRSPKAKKAVAKKAATKKRAPTKKNAVPQPVKKVAAKGKTITKEIAQRYLKDSSSVDLSPFTDLDDEAAEVLGKSKGDLFINVPKLSGPIASSLGNHRGKLGLSGFKVLAGDAALGLSRHTGRLDLVDVSSLNRIAAEYLANHDGAIVFRSLKDLPDDAAAAISKSKAELWFEALTTLSESAAESLSTKVGGYVRLQRLKSGISSKALHSLAKAKVFVFLPDNLDRKVQRLKE